MSRRGGNDGRRRTPPDDEEARDREQGRVVPPEDAGPESKQGPAGSDAASSGEGGPVVPAESPEPPEPPEAAEAKARTRERPEFDRRRLRHRGQDPMLDPGVDSREMWRIFRIISEFVEGIETLREIRPAISMWGSARTRRDHAHYRLTLETGRELAQRGYTIMTGGGPGLMEAANKGARRGGGKSVGLGIRLPAEQRMNAHVELPVDFNFFFIRKMMFVKYAAGLVISPGGFGTMDEFFDTMTLIQTRKVRRIPCVMLGKSYYGPLVAWMRDTMLSEGAIAAEDLDLWLLTDSPVEAADYLDHHIVNQTWWTQKTP
jgi:uncharacterized protein (TIGR00730 family)